MTFAKIWHLVMFRMYGAALCSKVEANEGGPLLGGLSASQRRLSL